MSESSRRQKRSLDQRLLREARFGSRSLAATLAFNAFLSIVIIMQALLLSQIIDQIFLKGADIDAVSTLLVILLAVVMLRTLFSYLSAITSARLALAVQSNLRQRFVTHLYALGLSHIRAERSGDLVLTATEGIEKLDGYFRDYLPGLFTAFFLPILILLVVLPLDALTFVVLLITAPLIPFFMALIGMAAGALAKRQFSEMRFLGAHFLDVMQGLTTLKLFNRSRYQIVTIQRFTDQFREATMRVLRVAFLSALTLEMLATLSVAIVAVEIGVRLINGGIAFDQALFLLIIAPEFYLPLRALGAKFHNVTEGKAAAERLYEVLDTSSSTHLPETILPVLSKMHIRFENITFAYDDGARPVLNQLSFTIQAEQHIALIGTSGSGKTTIANLLLRFIQPNSGKITVDGNDLAHIPIEAWREQIGWVSQSPYLFNSTIAENIRFSLPDASESHIIAAAQAAGAHEFIVQMPDGYQTQCGEHGLRLSGGQAQRIALARAFLRDAPLLILDEPTSQLDPDSEANIIQSLEQNMRGRTVLLITHRLNAAVHADQIILIDKGTIVEQGTHEQLIASGAHYAHLAASYGDIPNEP